jgi:hypothetical protein
MKKADGYNKKHETKQGNLYDVGNNKNWMNAITWTITLCVCVWHGYIPEINRESNLRKNYTLS